MSENGEVLVLVGARRYFHTGLKADDVVEYMEEVTITDPDLLEDLKDLTYRDKANNDMPMFVGTDHPKVVRHKDGVEKIKEETSRRRRRRT